MNRDGLARAVGLGLLLAGGSSGAEELRVDPSVIEQVASEEELVIRATPQIQTQTFDNHVQQHFIQDGRTHVIKVTPQHGSSYYLVDPDGDGTMGMRRDTGGSGVNPPRWVLGSW